MREPAVYAVRARDRRATDARNFNLYGRVLHASADGARVAGAEARAAGAFDEVEVCAYRVAAPGGDVRLGPVELHEDPHLAASVLYLVEGHGGQGAKSHWFETCGDVLYASLDDAEALQVEVRASGRYEEVVVLACPVAGPEENS
ncbi:MAG: hypothetical protein IJ087_09065 [Eggerthellaceae bacterium]|nr:hypothetical protein [Eggerthellaceae bacterium]